MRKRLEMLREAKKRYGIFAIIIEIYRVIMKVIALTYNFFLTFGGVILWRAGVMWSAVVLLAGSAIIYLLALKDHSEDKIYEWCVKKYHSADNLLLTTVILYGVIVATQTLLLVLSKLLENV
ncbi:MAG: hypothetical protein IJX92_04055 [Clostridia bacterium]|nr:hypothetical protein [Clostridia bacterium]